MSDLPPDIVPTGDAKAAAAPPADLVPIPKDLVPVAPAAGGPSWHERLGTGMMDPAYGAMQFGARLPFSVENERGGGYAGTAADTGAASKVADESVRKREASIQSERAAGGQTGTDWWRLAGNVLSPVTLPLAAIPGGAAANMARSFGGVAGAGLRGALGGTAAGVPAGMIGALAEPVTKGDYPSEKGKQVAMGGAAGAVLGGAVGGATGALTKAIWGNSSAGADKFIQETYNRAIKPTVSGKSTASQLDHYNDQVASAVSSIVKNKTSLKFADEAGEITGRLPQTIEQFGDAIEQTKQGLFERYDALAQQAGAQGAKVDLAPAVAELRKIAADTVANDLHPNLASYAEGVAQRLEARGAYSTADAQRAVQNLNSSLKAFYRNPSYESASQASVDALVANRLRKGLDTVIEHAVEPGYQALRNEYGALSAIEKDVIHRAVVEGRKNQGGGLMGNVSDVVSADEVIRGLMHMNVRGVLTGAGLKTWQTMVKKLRDPNRAVKKLFEAADGADGAAPLPPPIPPPTTGGMQPPRPGGPAQSAGGGTSTGIHSGGAGSASAPTPMGPGSVGPQPPQPTGAPYVMPQGGGVLQGGGYAAPGVPAPQPGAPSPINPFLTPPGGGRQSMVHPDDGLARALMYG